MRTPVANVSATEFTALFREPSQGVTFPIHVLAIVALGVHLLDYLQLEDLRKACEDARRWSFLFVAVPLRITGGTGSPLNPVAIL